jgi:ArsR family transcriptional regulator, cadmium/lead-responsive transcriptional repressor
VSPTATRTPVDSVFAALADPTRRELLRVVITQGPLSTSELADGREISRQAVAKHLGVLTDAGLLKMARAGRETRYEATRKGLAPASRWLKEAESAWDRRLDRLRRQIDGRRA